MTVKKVADFSDILIRNLLCAILNNTPYPVALLTQTELRIHAEQKINRGKAAIIKAWLLKTAVIRNTRRSSTCNSMSKQPMCRMCLGVFSLYWKSTARSL